MNQKVRTLTIDATEENMSKSDLTEIFPQVRAVATSAGSFCQSLSMTSDDDNSEKNSSFTHESVEIQSTKHTVDLEEGDIGDVYISGNGDVSRQSSVGTNVADVNKSDDGDVLRQSSVGTNETNKSQEETSVENEADENDFENDLNQSIHSGDGTSRNGDENGDGYSVSGEFGSVDGENSDQKVDDDQQHGDSSDQNENESGKSVDGGIRVPIGPREPSYPERVIIPEYFRKRNQRDDTSS
ncbi:hypothetical protein PsorP6_016112 [Peronosclerospora sorghi]|uniref:Uncharacterized protein n=1 Tax=Peronosclerospora sorghi TaxID=230839 RepID=A0ACC0VMR8_9STRA|nr:hypothetical protein PsorP6_016112 [Peronosclerospora sorghi]